MNTTTSNPLADALDTGILDPNGNPDTTWVTRYTATPEDMARIATCLTNHYATTPHDLPEGTRITVTFKPNDGSHGAFFLEVVQDGEILRERCPFIDARDQESALDAAKYINASVMNMVARVRLLNHPIESPEQFTEWITPLIAEASRQASYTYIGGGTIGVHLHMVTDFLHDVLTGNGNGDWGLPYPPLNVWIIAPEGDPEGAIVRLNRRDALDTAIDGDYPNGCLVFEYAVPADLHPGMGGDNDWDPDWDAIAASAIADGPAENAKEIRLQQPNR